MAVRIFNRKLWMQLYLRSFCSHNDHPTLKTVGIIVIGDEILKGEVADTNSSFLAREFHRLGLQLKKISVIGDNVTEVSQEVKIFSKAYDYVLTSGGIGPTHDDITYEAVALAFDKSLILNSELRDICKDFFKTDNINSPGMKLARIPQSAQLNNNPKPNKKMVYPNVSVNNVYMFPGIPELLMKSFNSLKDVLFVSNRHFFTTIVYFNITEEKVAEILEVLVKEFADVQFGSYPKLCNSNYMVKVTIESLSNESTQKAHQRLLQLTPKDYLVTSNDNSNDN